MDDAVIRIRDAIAAGTLQTADLRARSLATHLGRTTSVLYHHWGSLDGFLYAVAQSGFELLAEDLAGKPMREAAAAYVAFAVAKPALYDLMLHRCWDAETRRCALSSGTQLLEQVKMLLAAQGSDDPVRDARLLYGGLHGLASLAISGHLAVDDTVDSARQLVLALEPAPSSRPEVIP